MFFAKPKGKWGGGCRSPPRGPNLYDDASQPKSAKGNDFYCSEVSCDGSGRGREMARGAVVILSPFGKFISQGWDPF